MLDALFFEMEKFFLNPQYIEEIKKENNNVLYAYINNNQNQRLIGNKITPNLEIFIEIEEEKAYNIEMYDDNDVKAITVEIIYKYEKNFFTYMSTKRKQNEAPQKIRMPVLKSKTLNTININDVINAFIHFFKHKNDIITLKEIIEQTADININDIKENNGLIFYIQEENKFKNTNNITLLNNDNQDVIKIQHIINQLKTPIGFINIDLLNLNDSFNIFAEEQEEEQSIFTTIFRYIIKHNKISMSEKLEIRKKLNENFKKFNL